jgi:hypothetical protein
VLGEFPQNIEDALVQRKWIEKCRSLVLDPSDEYTQNVSAWDIATTHGKNRTVRCYREGNRILRLTPHPEITRFATRDLMAWDYKDKRAAIVYDSDGVGEGFDELLGALRVPYLSFHGGYGQKAFDQIKYKNLRTQFYFVLARKLERGLISLKDLPEKEYMALLVQLPQIKVKHHDSLGRLQIETKEDMHARGVESPDESDALMMSEYGLFMGNMADLRPMAYR